MAKPTLLQRVQMAGQLIRGGNLNGVQSKAIPLSFPAWRQQQAEWSVVDLQSYVSEGYNLNGLIRSAIMYKARSLSQPKLRVYAGNPEKPELITDENHPLVQLVRRPNIHQSWSEFFAQCVTYFNLAGNVFIALDRPARGQLPTGLYALRPDRVSVAVDNQRLMGYLYKPEGRSYRDGFAILPADMMHIKMTNPGDELEGVGLGLSPLASVARSIDVDNYITYFLKMFFENGAMPTGLLRFEVEVDETELARIKRRWQEMYGGFDNWTDVGVLDLGGSYQQLGMTFDEMGFSTLDERNESRILGPFGVPPILLGTRMGLERSTFSNYAEARQACWEDTLLPELAMFEVELQYYLRGDDGSWVAFDTSEIPALRDDINQQALTAKTLFEMGVPANIALATVGLEIPPLEYGDIAFVTTGVTPAEKATAPPAPNPFAMLAGGDTPPAPDTSGGDDESLSDDDDGLDAESDTRGTEGKAFPP